VKKKIILMLLIGNAIQAQQEKRFAIIPSIGVSLSNISGAKDSYYENLIGPRVGIVGEYKINKIFGIQTGVNYVGMGAKVKNTFYSDNFRYYEIPLNFNFFMGKSKRLYLTTGSSFSFLKHAGGSNGDLKEYVEKKQFGISYGLGYRIKLSKNNDLDIGLVGFRGLTDISIIEETDLKNNYLSFNLGYVFKI
jgi:hypothetical protein